MASWLGSGYGYYSMGGVHA